MILDSNLKDPNNWCDRLSGELRGCLYIDFTKVEENIENYCEKLLIRVKEQLEKLNQETEQQQQDQKDGSLDNEVNVPSNSLSNISDPDLKDSPSIPSSFSSSPKADRSASARAPDVR